MKITNRINPLYLTLFQLYLTLTISVWPVIVIYYIYIKPSKNPLYLFSLFLLYLTLFDKAGVMLPLNCNSLYNILLNVFPNAVTSLSVARGK